jgi:hypothetical protein
VGTHFQYTRVSGCRLQTRVGSVEKTVSAAIADLVATDINQRKDFCMSEQELKAELERLKTENEALKNRGSKAISMKVSEKAEFRSTGWAAFPSHVQGAVASPSRHGGRHPLLHTGERVKTESERISSILSPPLGREIVRGTNV